MDASVSLPDPGEFHHPRQNGHSTGLVADNLRPYDLDQAGLAQQTRLLEAELRAELDLLDREPDRFDHLDRSDGDHFDRSAPDHLADSNPGPLDSERSGDAHHGEPAHHEHSDQAPDLLPGFDTLTDTDLLRARLGLGNQVAGRQHCPDWCAYADLPMHGDGFDTTPEIDVPHRGVPHDIPVRHGGEGIDHGGSADISLQVEQDRDRCAGPVITLSVVVGDVEQYAWLTTAEATALRRALDQILDATAGNG